MLTGKRYWNAGSAGREFGRMDVYTGATGYPNGFVQLTVETKHNSDRPSTAWFVLNNEQRLALIEQLSAPNAGPTKPSHPPMIEDL